MTFMEKTYMTDAFMQNQADGILISNNYLDQHATWMR